MGPKRRAFVADDDLATRRLLVRVLRLLDFEAVAFDDGLMLADTARRDEPELVVIDQHMDPWDGTDTVGHLREHGVTCPALFVTAFPDPELMREATRLGGCEVLAKPVDLGALHRSITRLLARTDS